MIYWNWEISINRFMHYKPAWKFEIDALPNITVSNVGITFHGDMTVFNYFRKKKSIPVLHVIFCFVKIGVVLIDILLSQKCLKWQWFIIGWWILVAWSGKWMLPINIWISYGNMLKKWWISVYIAACIMFSSYFSN